MAAQTIDLAALMEEREWRKCSPESNDPEVLLEGFIYFCHNFGYIRHPDKGRIAFDLFPAQIETARTWLNGRYTIILKARQLGFSTLAAAFVFWATFFYSDRAIIMLSRTEREAIKLLQKAKYVYKFLPEWMKFRGPIVNMTQTKIEMTNESYIESMPSASDPARGESVWLVVVDELAFLPNSEEAWASIEPIADVGGRVIMLSTANGEGNLFHKLWVGAQTHNNRFVPLFYPWSANGRSDDWYAAKKKDLPEWLMASEYPDNPEDAFLKSGRPVFSLEVLRSLEIREPLARGWFRKDYRRYDFVNEDDGPLKIWHWPTAQGRYAIGADVSEGMEHGDFSSVHVIDARHGVVVAHWHGRIDTDMFGTDVLAPLGRFYNDALLGVESNNHGLTTLKALQRTRYHPLYMQRSPRYKHNVPTEILGWRTTAITKPLAADELNGALRDGSLVLWDGDTIAELRTFVRTDGNKMAGSPFDDRTISLMIAWQMVKHVFLQQFQPKREPGPGTMGWYERQLYGNSVSFETTSYHPSEPTPIGEHWTRKATTRRT